LNERGEQVILPKVGFGCGVPEWNNRSRRRDIQGTGSEVMVYHITKITNNSSKSVLLTNPKSERDTHLLAKNSSLVPDYPPKVEYITESPVHYERAVKAALNIYTSIGNWCFWDNGKDTLVGLMEGGSSNVFLTHHATNLWLNIDENGSPHIRTADGKSMVDGTSHP